MAGIDKTYIDGKEYLLYRQWWIDNYDKMVKELGYSIWLYTFIVFDQQDKITPEFLANDTTDIDYFFRRYDFPIWNTTEREDKWLTYNCKLPSFQQKMAEVYPKNWVGFGKKLVVSKKSKKLKYIYRKVLSRYR